MVVVSVMFGDCDECGLARHQLREPKLKRDSLTNALIRCYRMLKEITQVCRLLDETSFRRPNGLHRFR
jgi:hypothetical protein